MNVGEEMDRLAAEGRLTSVTLVQRGGGRGWQCYLNCSVAQISDTPAAALAKTLDVLPMTQDYDAKYGAAAVTARAQAEAAAIAAAKQPPAPECECTNPAHGGKLFACDTAYCQRGKTAEPPGIFD